jgi:hypothetical protein
MKRSSLSAPSWRGRLSPKLRPAITHSTSNRHPWSTLTRPTDMGTTTTTTGTSSWAVVNGKVLLIRRAVNTAQPCQSHPGTAWASFL